MAISDYYLTPDLGTSKDAMKRKMAYALLMQGTSGEPVRHWTQALARAAQGAIGGYGLYTADQADREREAAVRSSIDSLPGMTPATPSARPMSETAPDAAPPVSPRIASALMGSYGNNTVPTNTGDTIAMPPANPLGGMSPQFREKFPALRTAAAERGVYFNAPEAGSIGNVRTPDQQAGLYAQGRTAPGPVVTNTLNSNHLTGNAMDVVPAGSSPEAIGKMVTALSPQIGVRSGATFKGLYDPLHVENAPTQLAGPVPTPDSALPPNAQPVQQRGNAPQEQIRPPVLTPQQASEIRTLWADPATRPLAMQKYQEYSKPKEQILPLVTPQERAAAGIEASDKGPYTRNSVTGEIKSINNRPQVNVTNQAENSFEQDYGKGMAKQAIGVVESANKAVTDLQRVNLLRGMLNDINTGKLTPGASTVGAWMQSVGLDPKAIGIDPNLPATAEAATSLINRLALGNIGAQEGGIPANNFSEADREFAIKTEPSLRNRPEANDILLSAREKVAKLAIDRADKWAEARANGVSYEKFERDWRKTVPKNLFAEEIAKADALKAANGSPTQGATTPDVDDLVKKYGK